MDFVEKINDLSERSQKLKGSLNSEEATKTALILPFIQALGYDIFNPEEVVPEFVADVAGLKGEKIDYAIMQDGEPIMIIDCKCCGTTLSETKHRQLHRYFLTLDSQIGILTDGIQWLFYSSDDSGKRMDKMPFMEFSLDNVDSMLLPELRKLCKGKFDLEKTLQTVNALKYNRQIKMLLGQNLEEPQESFVTYIMKELGVRARKKSVERFTEYVKRAVPEFIDEQVDIRLKKALSATSKKDETAEELTEEAAPQKREVETTEEEIQGYYVVTAIMSDVIDPSRVFMRDTLSYCGILLDDKNNRPICRLHFNSSRVKYIETFDSEKQGTKHKIEALTDIYKYKKELQATANFYD